MPVEPEPVSTPLVTAMYMAPGRSIDLAGEFDLYSQKGKVYLRRRSDLKNIFSIDVNGTVRCAGPVLAMQEEV